MARSGQLYVVRHGETEWSAAGRHTGRSDLDLTRAGVERARGLAATFASHPFVQVRVSPLTRASRTAELAGLSPAETDDDLVEWDYGGYEGLTTREIAAGLGHDWSVWSDGVVSGSTPGESLAQVGQRVDQVLGRVDPLLDTGDVALVAHGHSLRVLTARWLGLAPEAGALLRLETASYGVLGFEHGRRVVRRWSVTA